MLRVENRDENGETERIEDREEETTDANIERGLLLVADAVCVVMFAEAVDRGTKRRRMKKMATREGTAQNQLLVCRKYLKNEDCV